MNRIRIATTVATLSLFACAVSTAPTAEETTQSTDEALTHTSVAGAWALQSGPIFSIDFTKTKAETLGGFFKGYKFEATVDTGVRCFAAPCPEAQTTVSGVYDVRGSTLTLASYDKPTAVFGHYLGDYKVTLKHDVLTLHKKDGTVDAELVKDVPVKCGHATCGAGTYCCNPLQSKCVAPGNFCTL